MLFSDTHTSHTPAISIEEDASVSSPKTHKAQASKQGYFDKGVILCSIALTLLLCTICLATIFTGGIDIGSVTHVAKTHSNVIVQSQRIVVNGPQTPIHKP